jgi:hypothetical protein
LGLRLRVARVVRDHRELAGDAELLPALREVPRELPGAVGADLLHLVAAQVRHHADVRRVAYQQGRGKEETAREVEGLSKVEGLFVLCEVLLIWFHEGLYAVKLVVMVVYCLLPTKPRKTTVRFAGRPLGFTVAIWKYFAYGMCFAA